MSCRPQSKKHLAAIEIHGMVLLAQSSLISAFRAVANGACEDYSYPLASLRRVTISPYIQTENALEYP